MKTAEWKACRAPSIFHCARRWIHPGEILPLWLLIDTSLNRCRENSPSAIARWEIFFAPAAAIIFIWPVVNFTPALECARDSPCSRGRTRRRGYFAQFVRLRAKNFFVLSSTLARSVKCGAQQFKTWIASRVLFDRRRAAKKFAAALSGKFAARKDVCSIHMSLLFCGFLIFAHSCACTY